MDPQKEQALIVSLRLLAASPKSRAEVARKLGEKGFRPELVTEVLDEMETKGLLSDKAFAQNLISRFTQGQPSGSRKISFELKRHGVPATLREEMLAGLEPEQEAERAREVAQARWERLKNLPDDKRKKRLYDFLIRRGFDFQLVRDIVEELESNSQT